MTDVEFEQYVRSLINEETARFWTPEDIASYKKVGISVVSAQFWNLLMPLKKKIKEQDIESGNRLITLPDDCQKITRIEYTETGDKVTYVQDEWFYYYARLTPGNPVGWTLSENKLYLFPEPNQALSKYLRIWYLPCSTTLADLPEELHPLIAVEAVMAARTKDENVSPYLERLRQRFFDAAVKFLILAQAQDPHIVGEVDRYEDSMDR